MAQHNFCCSSSNASEWCCIFRAVKGGWLRCRSFVALHILSLACEVAIALSMLTSMVVNLNTQHSRQGAGDVAFLVLSLLATVASFALNVTGASEAVAFARRLLCGSSSAELTLAGADSVPSTPRTRLGWHRASASGGIFAEIRHTVSAAYASMVWRDSSARVADSSMCAALPRPAGADVTDVRSHASPSGRLAPECEPS